MRILITGATGQLGTELCYLLDEKNISYIGTGSKDLDITDESAVDEFFLKSRPEVVFHCAAYTAVDAAEEEPGKTQNYKVNVNGTENIAKACKSVGAKMIYISTDYVFDGKSKEMYTEESKTNPMNEYGCAKLAGEQIVSTNLDDYYIIRTSWVFGKYGKNFVYTMLNLAKTHDHLTVVNDQMGRPTWTRTLAEFMLYAVQNKIPYGLYQLSNEGSCTWYEFAKEILKDKDVEIKPVTSKEYTQKAYRPRCSVMSLRKVETSGFVILNWKIALKCMIKGKKM
ncbi:MAG TPA: dTDP-4-dehydrorhamnose reductase [Companilactobacillus farciminis]|uniref:dTDP-4-dehydrorhamnose reductase n=1 Tax=Companilactobacillus farciminis TaxID=1612 RepID=A0A921HUA4_9LACO|nr:dTDP-4-dehydrorhamnose reductase [Companilactobacillus farciminis]